MIVQPGQNPAQFELRFASGEEFAREYDENLKNLGLFLPSDQPLPLHTRIQLRLVVPGRPNPIELFGAVVHVATPDQPLPGLPPGMAVQLEPFGPEANQAFAAARGGSEALEPAGTAGADSPAASAEGGGKFGEGIGMGDGVNIFQAVRAASLTEKIRLAKQGNRQVLNVLIQEGDKQIMRFVVQNPRLGSAEVLQILKNTGTAMEIIQAIAKNPSWMQNDEVRYQLVICPRTPLPLALQAINNLNLKDISKIAKSNSVKAQLKSTALRLLSQRR